MNEKKLKIGEIVKINSPNRLVKVHLMKGHIAGYSVDDSDQIVAYAVSIDGICWTAMNTEVIPTGEFIERDNYMTDTVLKTNDKGEFNSSDKSK